MFAGTLCHYFKTMGSLLVAAMAYFLNDNWQLLQIAITLPSIIFISYWWVMPESIRWLISKERFDEACHQVKNVFKNIFMSTDASLVID